MIYCFDVDETICVSSLSHPRNYTDAVPYWKVIRRINQLYDEGHTIKIWTGRGSKSGVDHTLLTQQQLEKWGVKYHELICTGKIFFDILVDDKVINAQLWRRDEKIRLVGFIAGAFDLLHAGHCLYIQDAKRVCDHLIAAIHVDPSLERTNKNKPIQSLDERRIQLLSNKYIDEVRIYNTEEDLKSLLQEIRPDVRILGSEYQNSPITGREFCAEIFYHPRTHSWSSSELRKRIKDTQYDSH